MIYGEWLANKTLVVAAADSFNELVDFHDVDFNGGDDAAVRTSMTPRELERSPEFAHFIFVPHIIIFRDDDAVTRFCSRHEIGVVEPDVHIAHQQRLIVDVIKAGDDYSEVAREPTMAERFGVAGAYKALAKKGPDVSKPGDKDKGLSGDKSFRAPSAVVDPNKLHVTDIELEKTDDGTIVAKSAKARRGNVDLDAENEKVLSAERRARETGSIRSGTGFVLFAITQGDVAGVGDQTLACFGLKKRYIDRTAEAFTPALSSLPEGAIHLATGFYHFPDTTPEALTLDLMARGYYADMTIQDLFEEKPAIAGRPLTSAAGRQFYRCDVERSFAALDSIWTKIDHTLIDTAAGYGEYDNGVWYAFSKQVDAELFRTRLVGRGIEVDDVYLVNLRNEPLLEAGGRARLKSLSKELPRPWNALSDEWAAMSPEERNEASVGIKGSEFYYARIAHGLDTNEIRLLITPRSYFHGYRKPFSKPLEIEHLLPSYLKEVAPSVYATRGADWSTVEHEMRVRRGFKEDISFQAYANEL